MIKPSRTELEAFAREHAPDSLERMEQIKALQAELTALNSSRDYSIAADARRKSMEQQLDDLRTVAKADGAKLMALWTAKHT
jgi:hypothetical protein